jgi:hypothetical protein
MKRLLAMAALLLASSTAQAQYQFEYGGRTIRIDPDRGTISIPGVYDNSTTNSKKAKRQNKPASQDAKADTQPAPPAPPPPPDTAANPPPPQPTLAIPPAPPPPATATTTPDQPAPNNNSPSDTAALTPPAPAPLPPQNTTTPPPAPAPTVAAVPPAAPPPPPVRRDPNSPVGVWLTEEKEGKVRIEQCGPNLCGYSVDAKTNGNGEQVLINMKPSAGQKWSGRIVDPSTGSAYDSTIALKGPDTLRVQGCAFGGMFCGGQTWTRVN